MLTLFENGVIEFLHDEHISTHHSEENNRPILQMGELVRERRVGGDTDISVFFEKRTHRDVWLQPMPAAESLVLCSSSDSVTIQSSATFSYCVLASILLAGIETRPLTHTHTHTLFLAQLQNNLHVHIYDLSYTSLSMVLLNI